MLSGKSAATGAALELTLTLFAACISLGYMKFAGRMLSGAPGDITLFELNHLT